MLSEREKLKRKKVGRGYMFFAKQAVKASQDFPLHFEAGGDFLISSLRARTLSLLRLTPGKRPTTLPRDGFMYHLTPYAELAFPLYRPNLMAPIFVSP